MAEGLLDFPVGESISSQLSRGLLETPDPPPPESPGLELLRPSWSHLVLRQFQGVN